jgi:hypothetical protein
LIINSHIWKRVELWFFIVWYRWPLSTLNVHDSVNQLNPHSTGELLIAFEQESDMLFRDIWAFINKPSESAPIVIMVGEI